MLNDGWNEGMTADESDAAASEMYRDAHPCCLECERPGCLRQDCPSGSCDVEALVTHDCELMHVHCVAAWDAHIANRCDGTTCHCEAAPVLVADDEEETTPVEPLTNSQIAKLDPLGVFGRFAMVAGLALALFSGGACAHGPAPAPEIESVGQLAAGPSIWHAPVHETTAPPTVELAGSADDDSVGEVATTTMRTADAGGDDAAPAVEAKVSHGF